MNQYRFTPPGTIQIREPDHRLSCACDSQPCSCHMIPTGVPFRGLLGFRCSRARSVRFQPCQVSTGYARPVSLNSRTSDRPGVISETGSPGSHASCRPPRCPSMTRIRPPQPCGRGHDRTVSRGNAPLPLWKGQGRNGCALRRPYSGGTVWKPASRPGRTMGGSIPATPNPGCTPVECAVICLPKGS